MQYFEYLHKTAEKVDPFVKNFVGSHFLLFPEIRERLLQRYRLGMPQLRPATVRLAYELVGGKNWHDIIPVCGAIEVKDTAYYCLDDVIDKEADSALLLQAVGLYSIANTMACDIGNRISQDCFQHFLREMSQLDENTLQGAAIDLSLHGTDEAYYMLKAEGYNFWKWALRIGGILGKGTDSEIILLGEIGKKIGMAHIIANDTWDFGKKLEDFRQGKSTLPIIFVREQAPQANWETLHPLFGKRKLSTVEIDTVRRIMVQSGAIAYGKTKAFALCAEAIELLQQFPESQARLLLEFSTTYTQKNKYYSVLKKYE
ncbi:MAG: polyprenyl synthetase family protein [Patescibacteria group bacterium]|jgi:geranylgeranyl pyrophosphate synthase